MYRVSVQFGPVHEDFVRADMFVRDEPYLQVVAYVQELCPWFAVAVVIVDAYVHAVFVSEFYIAVYDVGYCYGIGVYADFRGGVIYDVVYVDIVV